MQSSLGLDNSRMRTLMDVVVPDIGDFSEIPVIEILVKPGDTVSADQPLITLESDKATMDVPAPSGGIVEDIKVAMGSKVSPGTLILTLKSAETLSVTETTTPQPNSLHPCAATEVEAAAIQSEQSSTRSAVSPSIDANAPVFPLASPSLRRFARELGVELSRVTGTGPKGRILREDVQGFVKLELNRATIPSVPMPGNVLSLPPWPTIDFSKYGPVDRQPLPRIRNISGANLSRNWVTIPHVTNFDEADVTELEKFRLELNQEQEGPGVKITLLAFLVMAVAVALKKFPVFNASLDGKDVILKGYVHVGFAVDTPDGLVVPVIKNADKKGLKQLAAEMAGLSAKARAGNLKSEDMQGGCFSVSSLGGIGGTGFTPIINAPEVSILGVAKTQTEPVWDGNQFVPRLMLPLCLSWDHRIIDGANAARFLVYLSSLLKDFRRIAL